MSLSQTEFVNVVSSSLPAVGGNLTLIVEYSQRNLWHEMTLETLTLLNVDKFCLQYGAQFHRIFLRHSREYLNPTAYARMVLRIVRAGGLAQPEKDSFLGDNAVIPDYEANQSLRCEQMLLKLNNGSDPSTASALVAELKEYSSKRETLTMSPLFLMQLHQLRAVVEWKKNDYDAFYHSVFQYLAYCDPNLTLPPVDVSPLALTLATAALASDRVHNFGEFVTNAVVTESLRKEHAWLHDLLHSFNDGDLAQYKVITTKAKAQIAALPALADTERLQRKITLMALLHFIFYTPVSSRTFSFAQIAARCEIPEPDVEPLLLRAFALGLVAGGIDEVESSVYITYVQPRVLHMKEITTFTQNLAKWAEVAGNTGSAIQHTVTKMAEAQVE